MTDAYHLTRQRQKAFQFATEGFTKRSRFAKVVNSGCSDKHSKMVWSSPSVYTPSTRSLIFTHSYSINRQGSSSRLGNPAGADSALPPRPSPPVPVPSPPSDPLPLQPVLIAHSFYLLALLCGFIHEFCCCAICYFQSFGWPALVSPALSNPSPPRFHPHLISGT